MGYAKLFLKDLQYITIIFLHKYLKEIMKFWQLQLKSFNYHTISRQEEMWLIFPLEPPNLVNFLLYFKTLEVVKLRFMALEGAVHIVFSSSRNAVFALEQKQIPEWSSMASNTYHKCCNYCTTNFNIHFNVRQHSLCCYLMHARRMYN